MRRALLSLALALAALAGLAGFRMVGGGDVAPPGGGIGPAAFEGDDFNASCTTINPRWVLHKPSDNAGSMSLDGVGTGDSSLHIQQTSGGVHDAWTTYNATRVTQAVADPQDFTADVAFKTGAPAGGGWGWVFMTATGAAGDFLRADVYGSTGGAQHLYIAKRVGGAMTTISDVVIAASPRAFRIQAIRTAGTGWAFQASVDGGATWTDPVATTLSLAVAELGIHLPAGTAAPALDAYVDWMNVAAGPPAGEDATSHAMTTLGVDVVGSGTVTVTPSASPHPCSDVVSLQATHGSGQTFMGWSLDLSGTANPATLSMESDRLVRATFSAPTVPVMTLSTETLNPGALQGADATADSFTIRNTGVGTLNWSVSDDGSWLSVAPSPGTTTSETDTETVTYSTASLTPGIYNATISVTSSDVPTQTISVHLTVTAPGSTPYPAGSSDTGFNAHLNSLDGQTCQQYCTARGGWTTYTGSQYLASGQTVECKVMNGRYKVNNVSNVTLRCNDISCPTCGAGMILDESGTRVDGFLVEGNLIHDAGGSGNCGDKAFNFYAGSNIVIQYNDFQRVALAVTTSGTFDWGSSPILIQWNNYDHHLGSWQTGCSSAHTEAFRADTKNSWRLLHNRVIQSEAIHGWDGTAAVFAGPQTPGWYPDNLDIEYNYFEGGQYVLRINASNVIVKNNVVGGDTTWGGWHFGAHNFDGAAPSAWSGNKCSNGSDWLYSAAAWHAISDYHTVGGVQVWVPQDPTPNPVCNNF